VDQLWRSAHFKRLTDEERQRYEADRVARRTTSMALGSRLQAEVSLDALLMRLLRSAIDVTGAERGFVLVVTPEGKTRMEVASGFAPADLEEGSLMGSAAAVERTKQTAETVVVSDVQNDVFFSRRASIIAQGIATLASVPLRGASGLIGILYVDGRLAAGTFTDLDVEILEGLADQAAIALAGAELDRQLRELVAGASGRETLVDALRRHVES
jgi:GAF domain-containing protein